MIGRPTEAAEKFAVERSTRNGGVQLVPKN